MPIEFQTVINVAKVSHKKKKRTDCCARSPFSRIAVNDQTVFRIGYLNINGKIRKDNFNNFFCLLTLQPSVALLSYLKKEDEGRSMVIWPVIVSNSSAKESFCVISCSLRCINYVVFIVMLSIQKIWYLYRIELIRNLSNAISNLPYQYCCDRGSQNHSKGSSLQLGD